jgi:hypothetical protein
VVTTTSGAPPVDLNPKLSKPFKQLASYYKILGLPNQEFRALVRAAGPTTRC